MFGLFRSRSGELVIDRGWVPCPVRGDVESDVCRACRWLIEIDEKGAIPSVRCRSRRPLPANWRPVVGP